MPITLIFITEPDAADHAPFARGTERQDEIGERPMEFLTSREELRDDLQEPPATALVRKELQALDAMPRSFIAQEPVRADRLVRRQRQCRRDAERRQAGLRRGARRHTIAIPDRPGNNRLDTLENIIVNPSVGLLFLIPGMNETLRINGEARITVDAGLRERLQPPRASCPRLSSW